MAWPHARFAECRNAIERMAALGVKKNGRERDCLTEKKTNIIAAIPTIVI